MKVKLIANVASKVGSVAARTGLKVRAYSPELLVGAGIIGGIAATVMACKATLRADEVLENHEKEMAKIRKAATLNETYAETLRGRDTFVAYAHTGLGFVKLYGPTIIVGTMSIASIMCGFGILKKRNLALIGLAGSLSTQFKEYRERVIADQGEEKDQEYLFGIKKEVGTMKMEKEDGSVEEVQVEAPVVEIDHEGPYTFFFESGSSDGWVKDPGLNRLYLTRKQCTANDMLKKRHIVYLNDVLTLLEMNRVSYGYMVGWTDMGTGDGYIDFGHNDVNSSATRRFANGLEDVVLLNFNVDGIINPEMINKAKEQYRLV